MPLKYPVSAEVIARIAAAAEDSLAAIPRAGDWESHNGRDDQNDRHHDQQLDYEKALCRAMLPHVSACAPPCH